MFFLIAVACVTLIDSVCTALDVALGAVARGQLRACEEEGHQEAARARLVLHLLEMPDRLGLFLLCSTTLCLWVAGVGVAWGAASKGLAPWVVVAACFAVLFFGKIVPIVVATREPELVGLRTAFLVEPPLCRAKVLLDGLQTLAGALVRLAGRGHGNQASLAAGQLREALASAVEEGVIETQEKVLLESAMALHRKRVGQVMRPRAEIAAVEAMADLQAMVGVALGEGYSRLPVYEGSLDNVLGILATKDLIAHLSSPSGGDGVRAADLARPVLRVPAGLGIAATLEEMRRQRSLMAMVVEGDGRTAGLVTMEDLLEEIVGDIRDEHDEPAPSDASVPPDPSAPLDAGGPHDTTNSSGAAAAPVREADESATRAVTP